MQQPDPQPTDPQARLRLTRHAALQKPALRSFTPFRTPKAGPNCTSGRKGSGRIFRRSKRPFAMRARLRTVQAPLFPRYIFLILDLGRDRWLSVRGTVGVSSLFTSEDRPVPVPEGIVETLIQNSDEANLALFSSGLTTGC